MRKKLSIKSERISTIYGEFITIHKRLNVFESPTQTSGQVISYIVSKDFLIVKTILNTLNLVVKSFFASKKTTAIKVY